EHHRPRCNARRHAARVLRGAGRACTRALWRPRAGGDGARDVRARVPRADEHAGADGRAAAGVVHRGALLAGGVRGRRGRDLSGGAVDLLAQLQRGAGIARAGLCHVDAADPRTADRRASRHRPRRRGL
ncbi:MAG: Distant similarity with leukotriene C4 synthase (microsomal glutathione S-transferase), partial [uncultured Lysobacter sp.]